MSCPSNIQMKSSFLHSRSFCLHMLAILAVGIRVRMQTIVEAINNKWRLADKCYVIGQCAADPAVTEPKKNVKHHSKTQANRHPDTNKGVFLCNPCRF